MDTETQRKRAKERVEQLMGFYVHLGVFSIVNIGLFVINVLTNRDSLWFYWPLIGWGIAVVIHAFTIFVSEGPLGTRWKERKIRELMERDHGAGNA